MNKHRLLLVAAVLVALLAAPLSAQSNLSLVDNLAADAQGRFTTLVAALEVAGLAETLSEDGEFTLFAPTNAAFEAAVAVLGLPLNELLGQPALLEQILTYHVVPGERVFSRDFDAVDSLVTLEGSEMTLSAGPGLPSVNGADITAIDFTGSNGVYHVVDAVLLPPGVAALLPGALPEGEFEGMTPDQAMLRLAFFSPDSPSLVLSINGEPVADGVPFAPPVIGDWMAVQAGSMTVSGAPEGEGMQDLLFPFELTLGAGTWTTLAIVGSEANGTFLAQPILEDYSPIAEGSARMMTFHAVENAPAVDILADRRVVVSQLAYPQSRGSNDGAYVIELPARTVGLQVFPSGSANRNDAAALVNLPAYEVEPDSNIFFAVFGTPGDMAAVVEVIDMAAVTQDQP